MASARKPVIVRKFSREWYAGYAGASFGQESPALEVLDLTGKVLTIDWEAVKWVCYVRDFSSSSDMANPERLLQKRFTVRPRAAGLWLRMTLNDGDELEGIASNDRSLVTGAGLFVTPPEVAGGPVHIAKAIEDRTLDAVLGIARKGYLFCRIEFAGRIKKPQYSRMHQIVQVHVHWQILMDSDRNRLHQREALKHNPIAPGNFGGRTEGYPGLRCGGRCGGGGGHGCFHLSFFGVTCC